jgi:hypothetical protein
MDNIMQELVTLSKLYRKTKNKFFDYSDTLKSKFNLSDEQINSVDFGIIETSNPSLQKYVDILNNDKNLKNLNRKFLKIKFEGIIKILQYALKCDERISGYDLKKLLEHPLRNRKEINILFEGLAGVHHVHMIDGKIMMEIPARECIIKNRKLLKYVDFWNKKLNEVFTD